MSRRLIVLPVVATIFLVFGVILARPALAQVSNSECLNCHSVQDPVVDFSVAPVDKTKCNNCHWAQVHYFDQFHEGYYADYLENWNCAQCHAEEFGWTDRPQPYLGHPTYGSQYGWFQAAESLETSAQGMHRIHANGSWPEKQSACYSCHGPAGCTACHSEPATSHTEHTRDGNVAVPFKLEIGKRAGDSVADNYIYQTNPNTNYSSGVALLVGASSSGGEKALLRFPLSKLPSEFSTTTLTLTKSTTVSMPLRIYRLRRQDCNPNQATWNSYKTGAAWGTAGAGSFATDYYDAPYAESSSGTFDVTALLQAAVAAGETQLQLLIVDPAPVARRYATFYSAEAANDLAPRLTVDAIRHEVGYAYPPVKYRQAFGTPVGQEDLDLSVEMTTTCVNDACHSLSKVASEDFVPECISCHPWDGSGAHAFHSPIGLDSDCKGCHKDDLAVEHLNNPGTQTTQYTCSTCHSSTDVRVEWAIFSGNKMCSQCHQTAHSLGLAPVPAAIPQYPGYIWSPVFSSSLFAGEGWLPAPYSTDGNFVLTNRRTDVTVPGVFDFYKTEMTGAGWTLTSTEPGSADTWFSASFTKGTHTATVLFFNGLTPGSTEEVSTGYRLELLYK